MHHIGRPHLLDFALSALLVCANALYTQASENSASVSTTSTPSPVDVYTPEQLRAMSTELISKAAVSGAASKTLVQYPGHYTMLAYRNRSGGAEQHANFADTFVIIEGAAILQSGGTILRPAVSAPGEVRGDALEAFNERSLHAGDIVHIPAGTPHLLKLEQNATLLYFVMKVQEVP